MAQPKRGKKYGYNYNEHSNDYDDDYKEKNVEENIILSFGKNNKYQTGHNNNKKNIYSPQQMIFSDANTNPISIATGFDHSGMIDADGNVVLWGDNATQQISDKESIFNCFIGEYTTIYHSDIIYFSHFFRYKYNNRLFIDDIFIVIHHHIITILNIKEKCIKSH